MKLEDYFFFFGEGELGVEGGGWGGKFEESFIFFRRYRWLFYLID